MPKDDLVRVRHMLDSAREAVELTRGKSRSDLGTDRVLSLALVRLLEIVGEAANRVTSAPSTAIRIHPLVQPCQSSEPADSWLRYN